MKPFKLKQDFLMGSATAAAQIEGGNDNHNWYDWYRKGYIKDNTSPLRANDHWERYAEDIDLMQALHHDTYRMGLAWSRIEPEEGRFDLAAVQHYRDELLLLHQKGIRPLVTLHHFTHPLWLEEKGGFEESSIVWYFERFVRYVVEHLGDLITDYITLNEPNVYSSLGYHFGIFPPGKRSIRLYHRVLKHMTLCHITAYKLIHKLRREKGFPGKTLVGAAHHLRIFHPMKWYNPLDYITAKIMEHLFQSIVIKSMISGFLRLPIGFGAPLKVGKYLDFFGINYYTRTAARFKGLYPGVMPNTPRNDLDWEIYPRGLYSLCKRYYKRYRLPIWITENGTCDASDAHRAQYLYDHLHEIAKLQEEGIHVVRYYHWTLMDNFEWLEGESAPFGLIHVDFETQQRTVRKSGRFYAEICRRKEVTQDMIDQYLRA